MDNHTIVQRSYNMSRIKAKDTSIELNFRKYIWEKGLRGYRVNYKLKGKPDIYFLKKRFAVFIDGCFWHKCPKCYIKPKSNNDYWLKKIKGNIQRDKDVNKSLAKMNIKVVRFWEHEIKEDIDSCYLRISSV